MKRNKGFTLIEMLVAIVLLAIGVAAAIDAVGQEVNTENIAHRTEMAALLGKQELSQLELQAATNGGITADQQQGNFAPDHPNYTYQYNITADNYTGLYQVDLTVQWGTPGQQHSVEFNTWLINNQQIQQASPQANSSSSSSGSGTAGSGASGGGSGI